MLRSPARFHGPNGNLKKIKFEVARVIDRMLAFSSLENAKWYLKAWYWAKSLMIYGLMPLLKTSSYMLDYVKDSFMFIFLCKRLPCSVGSSTSKDSPSWLQASSQE